MDAILKTEDLTKRYGKARGIEALSISVAEGEFFGFIGPNGAGKSTTIRTLLGLISPTAGRAELFGLDCVKRRKQILAQVGYLPSEAAFYPGMRAGEVIAFSAKLRGADCAQEAATLCERLALDPRRKVEELSLGNRKKLCIICALQHKPRLSILDEPTSGLDPLMQKEFFAILQERHRAGATVFLSSHVLSEVQRHCSRAAIIREGRLVACDTVERLARTAARRVNVRGISALALPGMADVSRTEHSVSFLYTGEMPALIAALQGLALQNQILRRFFCIFIRTEGHPMTIFMHEMKQNAKPLAVWCAIVGGMIFLCMILFPEMLGQMDSVNDLFSEMGDFTAAFGMDRISFAEPMGFYGIECGNVLGIGGALFAAYLGVRLLSKEEGGHTAEFLLTHPVSRARVVAEKLAALLVQLVLFNAVCICLSLLSFTGIGEEPAAREFALFHLAQFCLQLEIGCICFGASALARRGNVGAGLGLAALLYFLNLIGNISEAAEFLHYITPFHYAEAADILGDRALNVPLLLLGLGYAAAGVCLAFARYTKKDIAA